MFRLLALLFILSFPQPAWAWWEYGHQTVARIAWAGLTPRARREVSALLRHDGKLGTPECPVRTIAEASVWPDCIKPLKDATGAYRFGYAYNWHFDDADICRPFDASASCKDGNCVTAQIPIQARRLADHRLSKAERLKALAFLVHLVGDLHQPLHVGDRGDKGGNDVKARYGTVAGRINLHGIWDGYLAERAISTPPGGAAGLLTRLSPASRRAMAAGTVDDWARESWRVAHDSAYAVALDGDSCGPPAPERVTIDEAKIAKLIPVVRLQVERGGVRLAKLLNRAIG
ncbi:MAG: S1/P1 nuclease [Sphingomonadaceae bacterium]|nr:S1/P1 nuclease [Sphingomonadaceae bacterium]